jgi:integrase
MAVYRRGAGKTWWYEFHFQGRRIRESSGFTNKTAALRAESKRKADLLDRRAGFTQAKLAPKFDEFVETFLAWSKQQHRPKTYALHSTNTDTLLRFFGGMWLDELTAAMVEDFKSARLREKRGNAKAGGTVAGATVNRALTTLKLLYNYAEQCGYSVRNPTNGVAFLPETSGRLRVVTFDEELVYLLKASQPLRDISQIILDTGLRPEEVFRMRLEDLDFARRTIFNPFGKTRAARRSVTMTDAVEALLKVRVKKAEKRRSPYVFSSPTDSTRPIGSVRKAHDAAVENAGIKAHFRLYDLRHTFATRASASGVDLPTLASMLGHTKIQMTMRYVHPAEEQRRAAAGKLETFRIEGLQEAVKKAVEKSRAVPTKVPTNTRPS